MKSILAASFSFSILSAPAPILVEGARFIAEQHAHEGERPSAALESNIRKAMAETGTRGLAVAVVEDGKVRWTQSWGVRNAAGDPLRNDTVVYAASITKAAFAYLVMQLVDEGLIDLNRPVAEVLPRPLPDYAGQKVEDLYARWSDLADDDRWRRLTPRMLLTNSPGFANFGFMEPDGRLRIHFEPGARYSYSGDGFILLQFMIEEGLGLNVQTEMKRRIFDPLGMDRTSLQWRPDFSGNLADGFDLTGAVEPHDERSAPRAAGSMDTTVEDFAKFTAAYVSGWGLTPASRAELVRPQLAITSRSQFPVLQPDLAPDDRRPDLSAGLGVLVFDGPQGRGFTKGGGNNVTANTWVCVENGRRCVVAFSNDARARALFPWLVRSTLGETGAPWAFEYPEVEFWSPSSDPAAQDPR